jgi:hypothetical protein
VVQVENINWRKEIAFAGVAAIVAFMVAAILRSNGAGKWLAASASGAIGGLAAAAVIA